MALPSISDLKLWAGSLLTKNEWDYNFTKIVSWFADGAADLVVNSITSENGIDLNGSRLTNVGAATSGTDAVNLDTAQTLLNRSSFYDLFTVCSGKEDASGNAAFLQKDSDTQVTILAGNVSPDLTICQSDGTIETLTSNTVLTVGAADDTYYIVKEKGENPVITSGNVGVGKVLPTSDIAAGDYFLDNSTIPFKAYKYDSVSGWVETPFCLLGTVVKESGTATVTPVKFDDNQYNLNVYNAKLLGSPDFSSGISVNSFPYTFTSDGWVRLFIGVGATGNQGESTFYINNISVRSFNAGNAGVSDDCWLPVKKGDVLTYSTGHYTYALSVSFYKFIGE